MEEPTDQERKIIKEIENILGDLRDKTSDRRDADLERAKYTITQKNGYIDTFFMKILGGYEAAIRELNAKDEARALLKKGIDDTAKPPYWCNVDDEENFCKEELVLSFDYNVRERFNAWANSNINRKFFNWRWESGRLETFQKLVIENKNPKQTSSEAYIELYNTLKNAGFLSPDQYESLIRKLPKPNIGILQKLRNVFDPGKNSKAPNVPNKDPIRLEKNSVSNSNSAFFNSDDSHAQRKAGYDSQGGELSFTERKADPDSQGEALSFDQRKTAYASQGEGLSFDQRKADYDSRVKALSFDQKKTAYDPVLPSERVLEKKNSLSNLNSAFFNSDNSQGEALSFAERKADYDHRLNKFFMPNGGNDNTNYILSEKNDISKELETRQTEEKERKSGFGFN